MEKNLSESELEKAEEERADRCLFVRDLIFGSLSEPQCDLNDKMMSLLKIADSSNADIFSKVFSTNFQDDVNISLFTSASSISLSKKETSVSALSDNKQPLYNNDSQRKQIQDEHGVSESFQATH